MNCPQCGKRMKGDWPDKSIWFNCDDCGARYILEDGELVNAMHRGNKNARICENCRRKMSGGSYTAPWENGNNSDGFIKCPHCGHVNYIWED